MGELQAINEQIRMQKLIAELEAKVKELESVVDRHVTRLQLEQSRVEELEAKVKLLTFEPVVEKLTTKIDELEEEVKAAKELCEIYFEIAADHNPIGEEGVRLEREHIIDREKSYQLQER